MKLHFFVIYFSLVFVACQTKTSNAEENNITPQLPTHTIDSVSLLAKQQKQHYLKDSIQKEKQMYFDRLPDSAMVELIQWDSSMVLDIRYATENNFMKQKVYPCAKALLRKVAAQALFEANQKFKEKGYRIKVYDGYRPLSVQWILWNTTTNKNYVANPRKGSNHNKGCAVDMTLVDSTGQELNMGTGYDFFGKEAHHTFVDFPNDTKEEILRNRKLLKTVMESVGFRAISNEWWHYDFKIKYPVSDTPLPCTQE